MIMALPTLAEIAQDRTRLDALPFEALWALLRDLNLLEKEITTAMIPAAVRAEDARVPHGGLLTLEQAATRLQMPVSTLRARANRPPFRALRGSNGTRYVCFRSDLIEQFIQRTGRL